jgi:preprotein translocase subunit SecE
MSKIWIFLSSVWQEAKRITWPSKKQLLNSTSVVLVILVFVAVYLLVVDFGLLAFFSKLVYPVFLGGN